MQRPSGSVADDTFLADFRRWTASEPGGYSFLLIRQVFDEVRFQTEDNCSHVILRKRVGA